MLHSNVLYCAVLLNTVLSYTTLNSCTSLYCTKLNCTHILHWTAGLRNTLSVHQNSCPSCDQQFYSNTIGGWRFLKTYPPILHNNSLAKCCWTQRVLLLHVNDKICPAEKSYYYHTPPFKVEARPRSKTM